MSKGSEMISTRFVLSRYGYLPGATPGELLSIDATTQEQTRVCRTLEPARLQGPRGCIPEGAYTITWVLDHPLMGDRFEVVGVPGRTAILLHPGNFVRDTIGCILLGIQPVPDMITLTASNITCTAFERTYGGAGKSYFLDIVRRD